MKSFRKLLIDAPVVLSIFTFVNVAIGATINVETSAQLEQALLNASGGDSISLAAGNYAANTPNDNEFRISGQDYSSYVTITSADKDNPAQFSALHIIDSSYIRLDGIKIVAGGREGIGIFNGSHHIEVLNSEIHGANRFDRDMPHYSQVSTLYGVYVNGGLSELVAQGYPASDVRNLRIQNIDVQDIKSSGYLLLNFTDSIVKGNRCDWMAVDCYKLANIDNLDFINNFGASNIYSSPTAHVDFVQGQGPISNSRFIGNVALAVSNQGVQGLFFDDATYTNLTFENNVIHTRSIRGISVSSPSNGTPSTGIVARYNTVLRPAVSAANKNSNKASDILIPSGSIKENNIVSNITTKAEQRLTGEPGKENIVAQYNRPDRAHFYDDYYVNASDGLGATIEDFTPVAGSAGETKGAFARIFELVNGTVSNTDGSDSMSNSDSGSGVTRFINSVIAMLLGK